MTRFRIIALCVAVLGIGLTTLSACSEDDKDERDKPKVWLFVSDMYDSMGTKSSCADFESILKDTNSKKKESIKEACEEYDKRKKDNGGYEPLTKDKTNSGYYVAAFILFHNMYEDTKGCDSKHSAVSGDAAKKEFDKLITETKCEAFAEDADNFTQKRNL